MKTHYHNARVNEVVAYLSQHAATTTREAAEGLGMSPAIVQRIAWRLAKQGRIVVVGGSKVSGYRYTVTSAAPKVRPAKPKRTATVRKVVAAAITPKQTPMGDHESVEEFLAHGGKVERLPSCWDNKPALRNPVPFPPGVWRG